MCFSILSIILGAEGAIFAACSFETEIVHGMKSICERINMSSKYRGIEKKTRSSVTDLCNIVLQYMTIKKLRAFALLVSKHSDNYTFQQMRDLRFFPQA